MWHDFISIKTRSGWERETETLCTELAVHIRSVPQSLAAKSVFQSLVFRSNLAGWQTDSLGRRNSSRLRFATLCRMCLKYGLGYWAPAFKMLGVALFNNFAVNNKEFCAEFAKLTLLLHRRPVVLIQYACMAFDIYAVITSHHRASNEWMTVDNELGNRWSWNRRHPSSLYAKSVVIKVWSAGHWWSMARS
jgi:hypothetical protein